MYLGKEFLFEAAHFIPNLNPGHKCSRVHGHSYKIEVLLQGPVAEDGMLEDFESFSAKVGEEIIKLDHQNLNEVPGLINPTVENICVWFFQNLVGKFSYGKMIQSYLNQVKVYETGSSYAIYTKFDWITDQIANGKLDKETGIHVADAASSDPSIEAVSESESEPVEETTDVKA